MKQYRRIWHRTSSGLLIPGGNATDLSGHDKTNFSSIARFATQIEVLYEQAAVPIPQTSDLSTLIGNAQIVSNIWFENRPNDITPDMIFKCLHLYRIADAVLPAKDEPSVCNHLQVLASGTLDFLDRRPSRAKDTLWELEVWTKVKRRLSSVHLKEPPDVVLDFGDSAIGIACKKSYSEKHVQNVLSEAVTQIKASGLYGVVAMNIDDLLPAKTLLRVQNPAELKSTLQDRNAQFIKKHERHFKKYLSQNRILAVIVSSAIVAEVIDARPKLNNAFEWLIWTLPWEEQEIRKQADRLYKALMETP